MANTPSHGYEKLAGSERKPLTNLKPLGLVDPNESIEVSVYLRAASSSNVNSLSEQHFDHPGRHLTREEYAARHSASPDDIAKVKAFAREHALSVVETDPVSRRVVLAGTAEALSGAFGTQLQRYEHEGRTFRGRAGPLHVPAELDQVVVGVFGLDDRPQAKPRLQYWEGR